MVSAASISLRKAETVAEKMIKVDHAGENGAVNIYRAQRLISLLLLRSLRPQLLEFQQHEEEHREIFRKHLASKNIRRCISYHACGLGGFVLGFITGLMGRSAIASTTYAVENVVLEHLEHQMLFLKDDAPDAYDCVCKIYQDEKEHHDTAADQIGHETLLTKTIIKIVKLSTEQVIRFGMR